MRLFLQCEELHESLNPGLCGKLNNSNRNLNPVSESSVSDLKLCPIENLPSFGFVLSAKGQCLVKQCLSRV